MKNTVDRRKTGYLGEDIACRYLEENGYTVIARNYTVRGGETDIIAYDEKFIVFAEVKCRRNDSFSRAAEAVDAKKISRLVTCAERFLFENSQNPALCGKQPRFDVIEVYTQGGRVNHIKAIDIN